MEIQDIMESALKGNNKDINKLVKLINDKKYDHRIIEFLESNINNSYAQHLLGNINFAENKYDMAFKYYNLSVAQGNSYGQSSLGYIYEHGFGVPQDFKKAFEYYQLSASQGNSRGQNNLGCAYACGQGVKQNYKMVFKYYQLSADQGNSCGQNNLGDEYYNGEGIEKDFKMAFKYYKLSADQGNSYGQNELGDLYYNGEGTEKDYKMAIKYYQLSANQGDKVAKQQLDNIRKEKYGQIAIDSINQILLLEQQLKHVDALNDHLKYYPGSSYKDALEDFTKISNK